MAKIDHKPHIEKIIGGHSGLVERQKVYHDFEGNNALPNVA